MLTNDFNSRLLDLRNMPFVAGRRLNWFKDIIPVANESLIQMANINKGTLYNIMLIFIEIHGHFLFLVKSCYKI